MRTNPYEQAAATVARHQQLFLDNVNMFHQLQYICAKSLCTSNNIYNRMNFQQGIETFRNIVKNKISLIKQENTNKTNLQKHTLFVHDEDVYEGFSDQRVDKYIDDIITVVMLCYFFETVCYIVQRVETQDQAIDLPVFNFEGLLNQILEGKYETRITNNYIKTSKSGEFKTKEQPADLNTDDIDMSAITLQRDYEIYMSAKKRFGGGKVFDKAVKVAKTILGACLKCVDVALAAIISLLMTSVVGVFLVVFLSLDALACMITTDFRGAGDALYTLVSSIKGSFIHFFNSSLPMIEGFIKFVGTAIALLPLVSLRIVGHAGFESFKGIRALYYLVTQGFLIDKLEPVLQKLQEIQTALTNNRADAEKILKCMVSIFNVMTYSAKIKELRLFDIYTKPYTDSSTNARVASYILDILDKQFFKPLYKNVHVNDIDPDLRTAFFQDFFCMKFKYISNAFVLSYLVYKVYNRYMKYFAYDFVYHHCSDEWRRVYSEMQGFRLIETNRNNFNILTNMDSSSPSFRSEMNNLVYIQQVNPMFKRLFKTFVQETKTIHHKAGFNLFSNQSNLLNKAMYYMFVRKLNVSFDGYTHYQIDSVLKYIENDMKTIITQIRNIMTCDNYFLKYNNQNEDVIDVRDYSKIEAYVEKRTSTKNRYSLEYAGQPSINLNGGVSFLSSLSVNDIEVGDEKELHGITCMRFLHTGSLECNDKDNTYINIYSFIRDAIVKLISHHSTRTLVNIMNLSSSTYLKEIIVKMCPETDCAINKTILRAFLTEHLTKYYIDQSNSLSKTGYMRMANENEIFNVFFVFYIYKLVDYLKTSSNASGIAKSLYFYYIADALHFAKLLLGYFKEMEIEKLNYYHRSSLAYSLRAYLEHLINIDISFLKDQDYVCLSYPETLDDKNTVLLNMIGERIHEEGNVDENEYHAVSEYKFKKYTKDSRFQSFEKNPFSNRQVVQTIVKNRKKTNTFLEMVVNREVTPKDDETMTVFKQVWTYFDKINLNHSAIKETKYVAVPTQPKSQPNPTIPKRGYHQIAAQGMNMAASIQKVKDALSVVDEKLSIYENSAYEPYTLSGAFIKYSKDKENDYDVFFTYDPDTNDIVPMLYIKS